MQRSLLHTRAGRCRAGGRLGIALWVLVVVPTAMAAPASASASAPTPESAPAPTPESAPALVLTAAPEATTLAPEPSQDDTNLLAETTRRSVRAATEWLARGVDSWFGDQPFEDGGQITKGQISLALLQRQGESLDAALRFSVHLRLPNVEKFSYVFLGRDDPRDVITDKPAEFTRQQRITRDRGEPPAFVAGLGLNLPNSVDLRVGLRGGLKLFAQARYMRVWVWQSGTSAEFRETAFWTQNDRFGSTTVLSLEQALSSSLALRWLAATTITQDTPKFETSSSVGAYQSFTGQRLLSVELLMDGKQGAGVGLTDYGGQVKWQQPVYREWLLAEILAGHFWPRPDAASPRTRAWAVGGSLKMRF